ncbi:hypothetical protein AVP_141 [Aerococcus phage vB_AviM_AVP]|nr:hypothetical protein AVP_141 [Aerococcus phage vB_AviM_AVP]
METAQTLIVAFVTLNIYNFGLLITQDYKTFKEMGVRYSFVEYLAITFRTLVWIVAITLMQDVFNSFKYPSQVLSLIGLLLLMKFTMTLLETLFRMIFNAITKERMNTADTQRDIEMAMNAVKRKQRIRDNSVIDSDNRLSELNKRELGDKNDEDY